MEKNLNKLIDLYINIYPKSIIPGKDLVKYFDLHQKSVPPLTESVDNFFNYFYLQERILIANPGHDTMSSNWILNDYGLSKKYKRNVLISKLLNDKKI